MKKAICLSTLLIFVFVAHAQWVQVNGPKDPISGIDVITNDSLLVLSTSKASVYSVNGGGSWLPFMPEVFYHSVSFQGKVYTGGEYYPGYGQARLRKHSFENGTWQHQIVYDNNGPVNGMAADENYIYVVFQNNTNSPGEAGFTYSTNGTVWQKKNIGLPRDTVYGYYTFYVYNLFAVTENDQYVFVGAKDGIYRATRPDFQWSNISQGLPANSRVNAIACKDSLLIIATGNRLYRSADNGQNWDLNHTFDQSNFIHGLRCFGDTLFVLTDTQGLFISTDQGTTWFPASHGLENLQTFCLTKMGSTYFLGHGTGISKGLNAWENINNDIVVSNVRDMDQNGAAMAAVELDKVFVSHDEGLTWQDHTPFGEQEEYIWNIVNVNGCFLFSLRYPFVYECLNYRSCDNGDNWSLVAPLYSDDNVFKLRSNGTLVIAWANSSIFLSDDTGDSWTEIGPAIGIQSLNDVWISGNDLYASVNSIVYHSDNLGQSWHLSSEGLGGKRIDKFGDGPGIVFAVGYNWIFKTMDQGETWIECAPLGEDVQEIIYNDGLVFACKERQVYFSRNFGGSWIDISEGLPPLPNLWGGTLMVRGDQLYFGTYTYGIWKMSIPDLPTSVNEVVSAREVEVFPNPAGNELNVFLPGMQMIDRVEILDLSGRTIYKGTGNERKINIVSLNPGLYLLRIKTTGNMLYHKKIVKR